MNTISPYFVIILLEELELYSTQSGLLFIFTTLYTAYYWYPTGFLIATKSGILLSCAKRWIVVEMGSYYDDTTLLVFTVFEVNVFPALWCRNCHISPILLGAKTKTILFNSPIFFSFQQTQL